MTWGRSQRNALWLGLALSAATSSMPAHAQVTGSGTPPMSGVFSLNRFDGQNGVQEDYLVGQGTKGPYTLGWKGLRSGSEMVRRDGVLLSSPRDYTLDPNTGVISFTQPLTPQQLVKVSYQTVPGLALQNSPLVVIPLSWALYQNGKSALTFNTLFRGTNSTPAASTSALLSSLSFSGSTRAFSNSTLTSGLYLDMRGGDWLDRSALGIADKTHLAMADIALNFSRTGTHFKPNAGVAPVAGAVAGKEMAEIVSTFHPISLAAITTSFKQTTDIEDPSAPSNLLSQTRIGGLALALKLPDKTQISAGRTDTTTTTGQNGSQTTVDTVKLDRDVNSKTHIAAAYDANSSRNTDGSGKMVPGSGAYSQKAGLSVTSKAIDQVSLSGSFSTAQSAGTATDTGALSLEATPFHKDKKLAKLKVKAGMQSQVTASGAANTASAMVEVPALTRYQASLSGGLNYSTTPTRSLTVGILDVNTKPLKFLELSGGTRLRDGMLANSAPDPSVLNTYNMKFALGPSRQLKLTGSFSSNPEAADGSVRHALAQMIGLESDFTLLKLSGQFGQEQLYDTPQLANNMKFGLDFRLSKYDLLSTAWEGHSLLTTSLLETSIYRLGYTRKLGSALDLSLSGSMTQQAVNGVFNPASQELKAEAKIGIHF